jgi:ATP-dependent protease Clp ATPase subunit
LIFIMAGSFEEYKTTFTTNNYGFTNELKTVNSFDLEKIGFMTELAGRIHRSIALKPLGLEELVDIAQLNNSVVHQVELSIEDRLSDEEIRTVCQEALATNKGGRGLTSAFLSYYIDLSLKNKTRKRSDEIYEEEIKIDPWKVKLT